MVKFNFKKEDLLKLPNWKVPQSAFINSCRLQHDGLDDFHELEYVELWRYLNGFISTCPQAQFIQEQLV